MTEWLRGASPLSAGDLASLFLHFALLCRCWPWAGAITTVPDMHRFGGGREGLARRYGGLQRLRGPGPGCARPQRAVRWPSSATTSAVSVGVTRCARGVHAPLLPHWPLTASRSGAQRREHRGVRAFTVGLAPITIGLLIATSWVLTEPTRTPGATGCSLRARCC
jgi:chromate transporter